MNSQDQPVGRAREDLTTPALVLDLDAARRNIAAMAERIAPLPAELRPHVKVHKSSRLARMQVEAGAIGVTTATIWEARAMVRGGVEDVLVANQVVGATRIAAAAALAGEASLTVAVDDERNVDDLAAAARAAGTTIAVLVEVDVGMGRCGVRTLDEALAVGRRAAAADGVELRGIMGYEGHCMLEPDEQERRRKAGAAMSTVVEAVEAFRADGLPVPVVSGGGTGTWHLTGANPSVTELQAGSYALMDAFHASLVPGFEVALTVLGTIISAHGDEVVLDVGRKAIGTENMDPHVLGAESDSLFVHEEHSGYRMRDGGPHRVGDVLELVSGYGPTTVNLYDSYHVIEDGVVSALWPVEARYGAGTA